MSTMDFSGFKKISQDENTAVFKHEKLGHTLTIAHKKLSPKLKGQLDAIPVHNFAEGGGVSEEDEMPQDESQKAAPPVAADSPPAPPVEGYYGDTSAGVPASSEIGSSVAPLPEPTSEPGPANMPTKVDQDPMGNQAATTAQIAALGEQRAGQQQVAKAQGDLGQAQAASEAQHQEQANQDQITYEKANAQLNQERIGLQNDIAQSHVDPNRYINSMSTGKEIRTGIGLILGGMGAGLTHGPNLAFQFLSNQIDHDIQSQKDDLGKKESLLSHNLQESGNLRSGMTLTRLHSNDILASQLRAEAAKAQNPIAQGNLMNIAGMFDNQSAQLQHQLAMEKTMQSAFSGGQPSAMAMEMLPPDKRERAVQLPGGGLRLASTKEGAKDVREQLQTIQPIFNSLDQLGSLGAQALVPGSQANIKAKAIQAQLIPLINENAGLKRLSAEDIGNIKNMLTDPTRFTSLFGSAGTSAFKSFLQDKLVNTMSNQLEGATSTRSPSAGHNFGFKPTKYTQKAK